MRLLTASEVWMVLASALTPSPSGIRLIAISPVAIASRVPNWKYTRALIPVDPTCLMFATLAMPATIVRNTIGPISIRIAVTNVVPTGSIAVPNLGQSQPTNAPRTIATITQKYSCRYHFVFLTGPVSLSAARESAIVPTSLSEVRVRCLRRSRQAPLDTCGCNGQVAPDRVRAVLKMTTGTARVDESSVVAGID